nr:T9SS type A sorting domain-containing protein [Bacteroidota bacterium]
IEGETFGVALGDIDNDGDMDAAVVDAYDDMEIYLNDGNGTFTFSSAYGSGKSWYGIYLIDVDRDEDLDIAVAGFSFSNGCEIWKNNGSGAFSMSQDNIASGTGAEEIAFGDVNGDDAIDMFITAVSSGSTKIWLNDGTGNFTDSGQSLSGSGCTQAVLCDFDDDRDLDAYVAITNGSPNQVWINNGDGIFTNSGQNLGSAFSTGVGVMDVDNDGDMDAIVSNWQVPSQIWLNDGNAVFTAGNQINNNNYAKSIRIRDQDYDYYPDIFIGSYGSKGLQVWKNDGAGNFELCYENEGDYYVHGFDVADINNDLMPDVFLGNFSSSTGDQVFFKETPVMIYDTIYLCQGDSIYIGGGWQTEGGNFLQATGCDTLGWYNLSVVAIDTTVTISNDTLFALPGYEVYQWLDCNTMLPIPGADAFFFQPEVSGSYAVIVTQNDCVDTSGCFQIVISGMQKLLSRDVSIYPNPFSNQVFIEVKTCGEIDISVYSIRGTKLLSTVVNSSLKRLDLSYLESGIYFIKVKGNDILRVERLVKK